MAEHFSTRRIVINALIIFAAALAIRWLFFAYRLDFDLYIRDFDDTIRAGGSDVRGWLGYANHFVNAGTLDYWMMGIRPPLYPLSVAAVFALGGGYLAAAGLQIFFGALAPVLGYLMARILFVGALQQEHGELLALAAGLLMVVDPASVSAGAVLLSEPLFNLLMTAFLLSLSVFVVRGGWANILLAALWMALTMLTRPTAIYLWIMAPFVLAPLVKQWWKPALILAIVGIGVNLAWGYRNYVDRGVYTYSMQTNFTLLFLRALSAEHLATGATTDEIQKAYTYELLTRIGEDVSEDEITSEDFWQFHVASTPEIYSEMGKLARERLVRYWFWAAVGTFAGAWRMFALTLTLPQWARPIELIYHVILYGLAVSGGWKAFHRRQWNMLLLCALPILYITGLTLASQTSAMDTRMRSPVSGPIIILAVYGFVHLQSMWQAQQDNKQTAS